MGQDGSLGLVDALLGYLEGPAVLQFSIWAGEGADVRAVEQWVERSRLTGARWIVDRSFEGRDPYLAEILRKRFGKGCIQTARMHAKAILLTGIGWRVAAVTSASLDPARRLEHWVISDEAAFVKRVGSALTAATEGQPQATRAAQCGPAGRLRFSNPGMDSVGMVEYMVRERPGEDLSIGTWCCSIAHLERVHRLLERGRVRSVRWLVDASMVRGNPREALNRLREVFGDECIRGCSVHGKFVRYGPWTRLTSANLNGNPRIESHVTFSDPAVASATDALLDLVWERQAPGDGFVKGRGLRINRVLARKGSGDD